MMYLQRFCVASVLFLTLSGCKDVPIFSGRVDLGVEPLDIEVDPFGQNEIRKDQQTISKKDKENEQLRKQLNEQLSIGTVFKTENGGREYKVLDETEYCSYLSSAHREIDQAGQFPTVHSAAYIPEVMRHMGTCETTMPQGNFHYTPSKYDDRGIYYSNGKGSFCGYSNPENYHQVSSKAWGDWQDVKGEVPFTESMTNEGQCRRKFILK